jgi:hypothetical protein
MSLTANAFFSIDGRTPMDEVTGEIPDISEYLDFSFYDWVWYKDNAGVGDNMFGRLLGVLHRIGNLMSFWIFTANGRVISRTTVQRVTNLELATAEVKEGSEDYDDRINELLEDDNHAIQGNENEMPYKGTRMRYNYKIGTDIQRTAETILQKNMVSLCLTPRSRRLMLILRLTRLVIGT